MKWRKETILYILMELGRNWNYFHPCGIIYALDIFEGIGIGLGAQ